MPRGRRRAVPDVAALGQELALLEQRQAALRQQLRRMRTGQNEIGKLEEKLQKQLAGAKWTANQIKGIRPDWDEHAFYDSVEAIQPKPRGRRPRSASAEG